MHSRTARAGFSLIESVVAVAVVAAVAVGVAALFNTSTLTKMAQQESIALRIANNKIEGIRAAGYSQLPANGSFTDTLMSSLPSGTGSTTVTAYNAGTKLLTVQVLWQEQNVGTTSITLTTLVTQNGGL